jgi:hypothetical protein
MIRLRGGPASSAAGTLPRVHQACADVIWVGAGARGLCCRGEAFSLLSQPLLPLGIEPATSRFKVYMFC